MIWTSAKHLCANKQILKTKLKIKQNILKSPLSSCNLFLLNKCLFCIYLCNLYSTHPLAQGMKYLISLGVSGNLFYLIWQDGEENQHRQRPHLKCPLIFVPKFPTCLEVTAPPLLIIIRIKSLFSLLQHCF